MGKVLGTPRHPFEDGYLTPCVYVFDQSSVGLLLDTNVSTFSGVYQLVMHAFLRDRFCYLLFPFNYLVSFRISGETMAGYTWILNIVH